MAVVEGGKPTVQDRASLKYKAEYSILGKDDHMRVQSVHEA